MSIQTSTSTDRCAVLRLELKQWEANYAAANGGNKAGREEIKKDAAIATKYKEYNRIRAALSKDNSSTTTTTSMKPPRSPSKQMRPKQVQHATPQKQRHNLSTPQKQRRHQFPNDSGVELLTSEDHQSEAEEDENASPVVKRLFVDPTPQKNGRVLGLFDLLSPVKEQASSLEREPQDSPSKPRIALINLAATSISNINGTSLTTPRKRAYIEGEQRSHLAPPDFTASPSKHSRTPQSAAKRYLLDTFVTPSKRRKLSEDAETPSNIKAQGQLLADGTPAFLRRDSQRFNLAELDDVPEENEEDEDEDGFDTTTLSAKSSNIPAAQNLSPTKSRLQRSFSTGSRISKFNLTGRAPLKRSSSKSLSSMIAAIRQTEDDRLDEEMELMRDMEDGNGGHAVPARPQPPRRMNTRKDDDEEQEIPADVLVEDSQFPDISAAELGPDGSHVVDTDSEPESGGQPRKAWKKKGLKRQTKRVIMRPTVRKPGVSASKQEAERTDELVEESQDVVATAIGAKQRNDSKDNEASGSDCNESDFELELDDSDDDGVKVTAKVKSTTKPAASTAAASAGQKENHDKSGTGVVKKAVKKISATANANFCKLKIRSAKGASGAKGIAFKRRFGKGRS